MSIRNTKIFLWIATAVIVVAYLFWKPIFWLTGGDLKAYELTGDTSTGLDVFFPLQALFMCMMCWLVNHLFKYTVTFILFWLSFGNLIDEVLLNNDHADWLEYCYAGVVLMVTFVIHRKKVRENRK